MMTPSLRFSIYRVSMATKIKEFILMMLIDGNYFIDRDLSFWFYSILNCVKEGKFMISSLVRVVLPICSCKRFGQFFINKFCSLFSLMINYCRLGILEILKEVKELLPKSSSFRGDPFI